MGSDVKNKISVWCGCGVATLGVFLGQSFFGEPEILI